MFYCSLPDALSASKIDLFERSSRPVKYESEGLLIRKCLKVVERVPLMTFKRPARVQLVDLAWFWIIVIPRCIIERVKFVEFIRFFQLFKGIKESIIFAI